MKLAEALNLRADLNKRISQLRMRLLSNAKVQENDVPAENPEDLITELNQCLIEFEEIIGRINTTNCKTFYNDMSITELLAKRDAMALKASILRDFLVSASEKIDRYSNKEIRILSTVDVRKFQIEVDKISKELRQLDTKLQELNWTTELL